MASHLPTRPVPTSHQPTAVCMASLRIFHVSTQIHPIPVCTTFRSFLAQLYLSPSLFLSISFSRRGKRTKAHFLDAAVAGRPQLPALRHRRQALAAAGDVAHLQSSVHCAHARLLEVRTYTALCTAHPHDLGGAHLHSSMYLAQLLEMYARSAHPQSVQRTTPDLVISSYSRFLLDQTSSLILHQFRN